MYTNDDVKAFIVPAFSCIGWSDDDEGR